MSEETFTRWVDPTIEKYKQEIERLNNILNKLEGYIITNKPVYIEQKGTSKIIDITGVLLDILKGEDKE